MLKTQAKLTRIGKTITNNSVEKCIRVMFQLAKEHKNKTKSGMLTFGLCGETSDYLFTFGFYTTLSSDLIVNKITDNGHNLFATIDNNTVEIAEKVDYEFIQIVALCARLFEKVN